MFKTADQLGVILEMIYLNLLLIKPQYLVNKLKFVQKKKKYYGIDHAWSNI